MTGLKRPLWERLALKLLYYLNGRAGFGEAFIRFFLPCYLADLAFRMIFVKGVPYFLPDWMVFVLLYVFVGISFLSLIVLWQCAVNLRSKFQFYLVRAICGILLVAGTVVII